VGTKNKPQKYQFFSKGCQEDITEKKGKRRKGETVVKQDSSKKNLRL